jgi:Mn-dependent DtxR family transcriptional regulator
MNGCSDQVLLATLVERGPIEMAALADTVEVHPVTLTDRCAELQSDGHVRQIAGGVYAITDDGRAYLESLPDH